MKALGHLLWLGLIWGCSTQSGHHIRVRQNDTLKSLAQAYHISPAHLANANRGKSFAPGSWVFIPRPIGLLDPISKVIYDSNVGAYELGKGKLLWPVPSSFKISSSFGFRRGGHHDGIDIPASMGSSIVASENGRVIYSGNGLKGYGNLVIIAHQKGLVSVYAHCKKRLVKKNQQVYRGQVVATIGNTGRSSGPHLHFEVRLKNRTVDPLFYVGRSREVLMAKK